MKALFFFVLGAAAGGFAVKYYLENNPRSSSVSTTAREAGEKVRDTAGDVKDSIAQKLQDWHLSGDDIKDDLKKSGQVVRSKAQVVGEKISDARILTVIKAKYVLDSDLSALAINVDVADGAATLMGTAKSEALIGRAVALALDTNGVTKVTSKLVVSAK